MLTIRYSARFKRDFKIVKKRGYDVRLFEQIVDILTSEEPLPQRFHDHSLSGNYAGHRECHITPDWLLIYKIDNDELLLLLTRTGTHSDLF